MSDKYSTKEKKQFNRALKNNKFVDIDVKDKSLGDNNLKALSKAKGTEKVITWDVSENDSNNRASPGSHPIPNCLKPANQKNTKAYKKLKTIINSKKVSIKKIKNV